MPRALNPPHHGEPINRCGPTDPTEQSRLRILRPTGCRDLKSRSPHYRCLAAFRVFFISIAMVIGPTPPGTGVIAAHFGATSS